MKSLTEKPSSRRGRTHVAFVFALVLLGVLGSAGFWKLQEWTATKDLVVHTLLVKEDLNRLHALLLDAETRQRGFLITGLDPYREDTLDSLSQADALLQQLNQLVQDNPSQVARIQELTPLVHTHVDRLKTGMELRLGKGPDAARQWMLDGSRISLMDAIRGKIDEMRTEEERLLGMREALVQSRANWATLIMLTGVAACILILLSVYRLLQREINQRAQIEDELRRSTGQLQAIMNNGSSLIFLKDLDGRYLHINRQFEILFGIRRDSFLGKTDSDLMPAAEVEAVRANDRAAIMAGQPVEKQEIITIGNSTRTYLSIKFPLLDLEGKPYAVGCVANDITEREDAQKRIRELNARLELRAKQLESANRELEAFSYSVSHDLRAPLRHIDGYSDLLGKHTSGTLDDKGRRFLSVISDSARKMGRLIDDLLVFSRMGRSELHHERVDLALLLEESIRELGAESRGRAIEWKTATLPCVPGDVSMLRQVFVNLLSNAIKYTRDRKPAVIEIGSSSNPLGELVIWVKDNGDGFDMQYAHKLFGVFQRLHRADQFEGIGIGLANVRRIVERHGGSTWAEGKPGEGATFFFSLPANQTETHHLITKE